MKLLLPIFAILCSVISTVVALVFCMAMGANSTPAQIRTIKFWMCGFALLAFAGIVFGIVLMRFGQTGWATGIAFLPTVVIALVFMISVLK